VTLGPFVDDDVELLNQNAHFNLNVKIIESNC